MAENIALRWSASDTVNKGAINIWLRWSQDFVAAQATVKGLTHSSRLAGLALGTSLPIQF
jgi:hypothetical protein